MQTPASIFWFGQDLRLSDNPGLAAAAKLGPVLPIYILNEHTPKVFKMGPASMIYLHHSLKSLDQGLDDKLNFYLGNPAKIITKLVKKHGIKRVFWSRKHEPWAAAQDEEIEQTLLKMDVKVEIFNSNYLWSPEQVLKDDGTYYKVFTPFKKKALTIDLAKPIAKPKALQLVKDSENDTKLKDLELTSDQKWAAKVPENWTFGEKAAHKKLTNFLKLGLMGYKNHRNIPGLSQTSKLSPNLHFGEISPLQIWAAAQELATSKASPAEGLSCFLSELVWREFACYLLAHFNELPTANFNSKFDAFPWQEKKTMLKLWQQGQTGYPIVDAGMRELAQTGTMHNRIRMVVASFLIKNLLIHWHEGQAWFWQCLVDADLASNSMNWQWVAGSGPDAAPYFRIFNPITQGEKFDKEGQYTRKFVPELALLPNKYLFKPWLAPEKILAAANIKLGTDYPKPIVDLQTTRKKAMAGYKIVQNYLK